MQATNIFFKEFQMKSWLFFKDFAGRIVDIKSQIDFKTTEGIFINNFKLTLFDFFNKYIFKNFPIKKHWLFINLYSMIFRSQYVDSHNFFKWLSYDNPWIFFRYCKELLHKKPDFFINTDLDFHSKKVEFLYIF